MAGTTNSAVFEHQDEELREQASLEAELSFKTPKSVLLFCFQSFLQRLLLKTCGKDSPNTSQSDHPLLAV